ncbi:hypothetical protein CSQ94_15960 [Janthinobacterium sp. BJB312]|nr:hypothetical protein CSQ94_15960 [Janthinobacterium sp. BJB312]
MKFGYFFEKTISEFNIEFFDFLCGAINPYKKHKRFIPSIRFQIGMRIRNFTLAKKRKSDSITLNNNCLIDTGFFQNCGCICDCIGVIMMFQWRAQVVSLTKFTGAPKHSSIKTNANRTMKVT